MMGKDNHEHNDFNTARDALSFLLKDEADAVDGYDEVLRSGLITDEADRVKLERIRNTEIDHIKDLSDIYQKYSTVNVVGKDSKHRKWFTHEAQDGSFYFQDSVGNRYLENGSVKRFNDRVDAYSFFVKHLYDSVAWEGKPPYRIKDEDNIDVKDYSARGSFGSLEELRRHYPGSKLISEGDNTTVITREGSELLYSDVGGKFIFIRGKN